VTHIPIARQRLSKHVQTNTNNTSGVLFGSVLRPLLGSSQRSNGLAGQRSRGNPKRHARNNRKAVFSVRGLCRRFIRCLDDRLQLCGVPKFQENNSVVRSRTSAKWVELAVQGEHKKWQEDFIVIWSDSSCDKSVARKRIVKTSGNRLRRLVWSDL
jgi:hypothetical protein